MVEKAPERRVGVDRYQAVRLAADAYRKGRKLVADGPGPDPLKTYALVRSLRTEAQGWLAHATALKLEQLDNPQKENWGRAADAFLNQANALSAAAHAVPEGQENLRTIAKYWLRREQAPYRNLAGEPQRQVQLGTTFLLSKPKGDPFFLDHQNSFALATANAQVPDQAKVQLSLGTRRNRGWKEYVEGLPPLFETTVKGLRPDQRWLEVGMGEGHVIDQAFQNGLAAHVTGVDLGDLLKPERFSGKPFEFRKGDIHTLDFPEQYDVGTDYFTAASYAGSQLTQVLQKEFDLIKPGGLMFFHITDGDAGAITQIEMPDGSMRSLSDWMKSIPGLELADQRIRHQQPDHSQALLAMGLGFRKVGDVKVPQLDLVGHLHMGPPLRVYRQTSTGK
jgi:hypothetical protein